MGVRFGSLVVLLALGMTAACAQSPAPSPMPPPALPDLLGDEPTDGTPAGLSPPQPAETEATPEQLDQLAKLTRAAEKDRSAAERLAEIYLDGHWVPRDLAAAAAHLKKAIELGSTTALNKLGVLLANGGPGLPRDPVQGLAYLQRGASAHDPKAVYNLAQQYRSGDLVERDESAAYRLFHEVSEVRSDDPSVRAVAANAQTNLGILSMDGLGTKRDPAAAVELWKQASAADNVRAWYFLGLACARGEGTAKDAGEARKWLQKAFDKGFSPAAAAITALDRK